MGNLRRIRKQTGTYCRPAPSPGPEKGSGSNSKGQQGPERLDIERSELQAILERVKANLSAEEYDTLHAAFETLLFLTQELGKKRVSIQRLQKLLFGATTEKTREIVQQALNNADAGSDTARKIDPVFEAMIRQAAQGRLLHHDDTTMKILGLAEHRREPTDAESAQKPNRTGVFTSSIVSVLDDHRIARFFTGHRHAGENRVAVLKQRASQLGPPIQMCDALSRNMPEELNPIVAHCLAHGRRRFVDVAVNFPQDCLHMLEGLKDVYKNDAEAKSRGMSSEERLRWRQDESGPKMDDLKTWLTDPIAQHKVEPNSGLGEAIPYMLKHWEALTLFLRVAGAPLDNNVCEQALKKAILHRKNASFYKTENGARVGDLFMSLIHPCELNKINPFEYLTALQKNANRLPSDPDSWLPWNYRGTLQKAAA